MSKRTITIEEFKNELIAQGVTREHFAVVCVQCGTVQSRQDFVNAKVHPNIEEAQRHWGFSCIGRWVEGTGCDWSLGGLFRIHKLELINGDESDPFPCFEPATPQQAQKHATKEGLHSAAQQPEPKPKHKSTP